MEEKKAYELKTLTSKDVFALVRIIKKFGISQFKECFFNQNIKKIFEEKSEESEDNKSVDKALEAVGLEVAFDIANIVVSNITECEDEIYAFLSQISNLNKKQIENLSMVEFFEMIVDVIQKKEFKDFFGLVSKFLK